MVGGLAFVFLVFYVYTEVNSSHPLEKELSIAIDAVDIVGFDGGLCYLAYYGSTGEYKNVAMVDECAYRLGRYLYDLHPKGVDAASDIQSLNTYTPVLPSCHN
jgi:hypothetical protein